MTPTIYINLPESVKPFFCFSALPTIAAFKPGQTQWPGWQPPLKKIFVTPTEEPEEALPTIEIKPTQVRRGQEIDIFGQAFPESEIQIFISPKEIVRKTKASSEGDWKYILNTSPLEEGKYDVVAKAFYGDGEQSSFSHTLSFLVLFLGFCHF